MVRRRGDHGDRSTEEKTMIPHAAFGSTGHNSSRVIFGAAAFGRASERFVESLMDTLTSAGVNHIDTAASYGDSELALAPWLARHRDDVFLATKTGDRTGPEARASLELSLERLGVDSVDLIQLHNLVEPEEFEVAHGPGGAVEALAQARDEGLVSHIGVTGHGTRIAGMHLRSLERFDFASVLLPYNFSMLDNPAYRSDVEALLEMCATRKVAVQTIKAVAKGRWVDMDAPHRSWYEPLDDDGAIDRAVRHVLSNSQTFLNTTSDGKLVPAILAAAQGELSAPCDDEMRDDVERFGISALFDGGDLERIR
ncbi:MAG: aryl-alcohol dehydrogenase-like predicted oxidoreductase [Candidatus Poriferisodalaceae bacterium]|jgi:aryl-alcohol dehydrogenase-like predicted oxidoreductase